MTAGIHNLNPLGTAYDIGVCADITHIALAVDAAIDDRLELHLSIRPHAHREDADLLPSTAALVDRLAQDRGRHAWMLFANWPHHVRVQFRQPPHLPPVVGVSASNAIELRS